MSPEVSCEEVTPEVEDARDESATVDECKTLAQVWDETAAMLQDVHAKRDRADEEEEGGESNGVPPRSLYAREPFIAKRQWALLGDLVSAQEKRPCPETDNVYVPGSRWISLRLDGTGFSKYVQKMRREGVFPERGYSPEFAEIMQVCAQKLMDKNKGYCAYTQSDEITVLVAPTSLQPLPRGAAEGAERAHFPHDYNGRVQKLASQNAAYCAALFNHQLVQFYARSRGAARRRESEGEKKAQVHDEESESDPTAFLPPMEFLATFDCRVGSYATKEEALSLVLWRARDCGVNGISDKVHHLKGDTTVLDTPEKVKERSAVSAKSSHEKIKWLHQMGLFPLPEHQAYGSFYCAVRRVKTGVDPRTGKEAPPTLRRTLEKVSGNVVDLYVRGALFPEDDVLEA